VNVYERQRTARLKEWHEMVSHPKLQCRPAEIPQRRRLPRQHAVFGTLTLVNRDWHHWFSLQEIAGVRIPCELHLGTNYRPQEIDQAADLLQQVQTAADSLRDHCNAALQAADYTANCVADEECRPVPLGDLPELNQLRPCRLLIWPDHADLLYEFDALPAGHLLGAHVMQVRVDAAGFGRPYLMQETLPHRARRILDRPLSDELAGWYVNCLADQCVASALTIWGFDESDDDPELLAIFAEALRDLERWLMEATPEAWYYLRSVWFLINDMHRSLRDISSAV
jgi:hypothetical protein